MRALFWVLAISVLAAGVVAAARYNTGYAMLVFPSHRVEISLNLMFVLLAAAFVLGYLVVRVIFAALRLPRQVREYRRARRRDQAQAAVLEAVREYFAGRYGRAEQAAQRCVAFGEHVGLSAALAARAAHELRAADRRDQYLARAAAATRGGEAVNVVTEAELLLAQRRDQDALAVLRALPEKHTAALRLELRAQQMARNWEAVLALVDQLERRNVYDAEQADQIRRYAQCERFTRLAADPRALEDAWQKLPQRQQRDASIAFAAARSFVAAGNGESARPAIEASLETTWDSELAAFYAECPGSTVAAIERMEAWLAAHPQDAALLLALGRLCVRQGLWGKSQSYMEASLALEPGYAGHLALARLHEQLGDADAAGRHYRESLNFAVRRLERDTAQDALGALP